MRERERVLKSIVKDEQDAQRIKERDDPAKAKQRADNVKDYEQKQLDQVKREEDLVKKRADSEKRAQENKKGNPLWWQKLNLFMFAKPAVAYQQSGRANAPTVKPGTPWKKPLKINLQAIASKAWLNPRQNKNYPL